MLPSSMETSSLSTVVTDELHVQQKGASELYVQQKGASEHMPIDVEEQDSCLPGIYSKNFTPRLSDRSIWKKIGAEVIATFIFIFAGCGAVMVAAKNPGQLTHLGICAVFGLVVMTMIYSVGHISGAHLNPAVTVAFATARHFPWTEVPVYVGAQFLAAITACFCLRLIFGSVAHIGATLPAGSDVQALFIEIIATFILMFVVSAVATDSRAVGELAGLAIGSTIALNALFAGPISGCSMNPARSIAPAIAANQYKSLWLYVVGPIIGATAGALSYNLIRLADKPGAGPSKPKKFSRQSTNKA
eukprot:c6529_g1_i1 orf=395-1303(-)